MFSLKHLFSRKQEQKENRKEEVCKEEEVNVEEKKVANKKSKKEKKLEKLTIDDLVQKLTEDHNVFLHSRNVRSNDKNIYPPTDPNKLYIGIYKHNIRGPLHIGINLKDRLRHIAIFGGTGMGKTTLLVNMIIQDIKNGYGLCFIDPKGDAIEEVLMRIPEERIGDVILIDPANYDKVVGLNFLELPRKNMTEEQINVMKEVVVADLVALMRQQTKVWGERFGRIFETLVRAILDFNERVPEEEQLTFLDLYVLLTDDDVRNKFAEIVDDPIIREYLLKVNEMPEDVVEPVIRRLNDWVMNKVARQMVTHRKSSFDFREAIDTGKIILVRIPKGEVGETIMQLVGTTILSKIWAAAKSRVNVPPEERRPFFLYIDEFKNFAFEGSTFDEILSEARAFGLGLVIATQYPSQLSSKIEEAVYANCGTIISFNPQNPKDAKILVRRYPNVKDEVLLSLGLYKAMVRVMVDNQLTDPFVIQTYPPPPKLRDRKEIIIVAKKSLEKYGVERIDETSISHTILRIKELCALRPKAGLIEELLEVLYALVLKGVDINYITFTEEARKRGINVDQRKYDSFKEVADKAGYIELRTNVSTGRLEIIPKLDVIKNSFWADKLGEPTDGFIEHRRLIIRAYEYFTKLGYIVEVPKPGKYRAEFGDDYTPDLILRVPPTPEDRMKCYKYFPMKEKIVVEVEVSTASRPGLILKKLARAYKAGYFVIFIVLGYGETYQEYISVAKQIVAVIEGMRGKHGFYKTDEIEKDEHGRKLWVHRISGEIAYEKDGMLYSKKGNSYICTVNEAKDKGWVRKRVEFDPSKEFKDVEPPKYNESCVVVIFPAENLDFPVTKFVKGKADYYLITMDNMRNVTDEIKAKLRNKDKNGEQKKSIDDILGKIVSDNSKQDKSPNIDSSQNTASSEEQNTS